MPNNKNYSIIFLSLLFMPTVIFSITVYPFNKINGETSSELIQGSPKVQRFTDDFDPFYAVVVFPGVPRAAQMPVNKTINGEIVLVDKFVTFVSVYNTTDFPDDLCIRFSESGDYDGLLLMQIFGPAEPGQMDLFYTNVDHSLVNVPVVEIGLDTLNLIVDGLENGTEPVVVYVPSKDVNPWRAVYSSNWFRVWQLIIVPFCVFNFCFAVKKIIVTIDRDQCKANAGQVTLFFLAFANLFRATVFLLDPMFSTDIFPWGAGTILMTLHFPFEQITLLLLSFFWVTLIDEVQLGVQTFLGVLSIPFGIIAAILFAQEIISGIIRASTPGSDIAGVVTLSAILYIVFNIGIGIFFLWNGIKVLQLTKSMDTPFYKRLRKVTYRILAAGAVNVLWIIPLLVPTFFPFVFFSSVGNTITWFFIMIILLTTGFLEISAITVPPKSQSKFLSKKKTSITTD